MVTEKLNIQIKKIPWALGFLGILILNSNSDHNFDFNYFHKIINFDFFNLNDFGVMLFL
jgi:hypothetical protein